MLGTGFVRTAGWTANLGLRLSLIAMLARVLRAAPDDPRFTGKGIGARYLAVGLPASLFVPAVHLLRGRGRRYPAWTDDLYLSILVLDLAGNVFHLYDRYPHFDLIPHAHGTGAITVVFAELFQLPADGAVRIATVGHLLLEAQEIASDVVFGLRNVRGWWDVVGDVGAGVIGTIAYAAAYERMVRVRAA
jgi:hypothetical protein